MPVSGFPNHRVTFQGPNWDDLITQVDGVKNGQLGRLLRGPLLFANGLLTVCVITVHGMQTGRQARAQVYPHWIGSQVCNGCIMADRHLEMQEAIKCTTNVPLTQSWTTEQQRNGLSNSLGQQPGKSPSLCYLYVRTQAGRLRFLSHSIPVPSMWSCVPFCWLAEQRRVQNSIYNKLNIKYK